MTTVLAEFAAAGFGASFRPGGRAGMITCSACRRDSDAASFAVGGLRRLEGASDPDEMVAVCALTCPFCGSGGSLVLGFGPIASVDDEAVLTRLPRDAASDADRLRRLAGGHTTPSDGA